MIGLFQRQGQLPGLKKPIPVSQRLETPTSVRYGPGVPRSYIQARAGGTKEHHDSKGNGFESRVKQPVDDQHIWGFLIRWCNKHWDCLGGVRAREGNG